MSIQAESQCDCKCLQVYKPPLQGNTVGTNKPHVESLPCSKLPTLAKSPDSHPLTIIFAYADSVRGCTQCKALFSDIFYIPEMWWTTWARRSNGYFGCEEIGDEQNRLKAYTTWCRFLVKDTKQNDATNEIDYRWFKWNIFTCWMASSNKTYLIAFDPTEPVKDGLLRTKVSSQHLRDTCKDPYWVYVQLLEQVVALQDVAVWGIRGLVRTREKNRPALSAPNPDYQRDHDIARHAIHVSETAELAITTSAHIVGAHADFVQQYLCQPLGEQHQVHRHNHIYKQFRFLEHMMHSLKARSNSNRDRLLNEIQLAYNLVSQYDSQTSVAIGRATQYDSFSMRTIAFLTLAFLPATFISALFSMSFFDFDPDMGWSVSANIWIYFAIAVPVTAITVSAWFFWQRLFPVDMVTPIQVPEHRGMIPAVGPRGTLTATWRVKDGHQTDTFPV
ncbi:hypothetical protein QBC34DRAFT_407440 [Podospora aff. communis PSN243]|uniref:Uncharacterized protein n=1 Tax=Podospora aff. communis PSN243 TaxID=3040156 RepID=A0AAV9GJD4_9PEZI|nr:hypothetical protein QBC34DRAFT_407440 [Podospora aff. communis PSN243]